MTNDDKQGATSGLWESSRGGSAARDRDLDGNAVRHMGGWPDPRVDGRADLRISLDSSQWHRPRFLIPFALMLALVGGLVWAFAARWEPTPVWAVASVSFAAIIASTVVGWFHRPHARPLIPRGTVGVVVPVYNEDPAAVLRGLRSIVRQSRKPNRIYVVDDCSATTEALDAVEAWAADVTKVEVICYRLETNQGKRHAQAWAFEQWEPDVWVTVDSDTYLDREALSWLLAPFRDGGVVASTGRVQSWNWETNSLTRIVDVEMGVTAVGSRSLAGLMGSVLVSTGAIAAYRGPFVTSVMPDYLGETFRGRPVKSGDDRRLTMLALLRGRTVYVNESVALSLMPEKLRHLLKQRIRWSASWYRGTLWGVRYLPMGAAFGLLVTNALRATLNFVTLPFTVWLMVAHGATVIVPFGVAITAIYAVRGLRLIPGKRPDQTLGQTVGSLMLIPIVAIVQVAVLSVVHWLAVFWVFDQKWGTRSTVEVKAT